MNKYFTTDNGDATTSTTGSNAPSKIIVQSQNIVTSSSSSTVAGTPSAGPKSGLVLTEHSSTAASRANEVLQEHAKAYNQASVKVITKRYGAK